MQKLYKKIDGKTHYWETWANKRDKITIIHWGIVGEAGEAIHKKSDKSKAFKEEIKKRIDKVLSEGYKEIDIDDHFVLLIKYAVNAMGDVEDLDKRHRLEDKMNETLGWTGLGMCDGGSIGSGTMEVCCYVVDFDIAKRVIEEDLKGTEFEGYTKIVKE